MPGKKFQSVETVFATLQVEVAAEAAAKAAQLSAQLARSHANDALSRCQQGVEFPEGDGSSEVQFVVRPIGSSHLVALKKPVFGRDEVLAERPISHEEPFVAVRYDRQSRPDAGDMIVFEGALELDGSETDTPDAQEGRWSSWILAVPLADAVGGHIGISEIHNGEELSSWPPQWLGGQALSSAVQAGLEQ